MKDDVVCAVCEVAIPAAERLALPVATSIVSGFAVGVPAKNFWVGVGSALLAGLITAGIQAAAQPVCGRCRPRTAMT